MEEIQQKLQALPSYLQNIPHMSPLCPSSLTLPGSDPPKESHCFPTPPCTCPIQLLHRPGHASLLLEALRAPSPAPHSLRIKIQTISPGAHSLLALQNLAFMPSGISFPTMSSSAISSKCRIHFSVSLPLAVLSLCLNCPNAHTVPCVPGKLLLVHHSLAEVALPLSSLSRTFPPSIHQNHSLLIAIFILLAYLFLNYRTAHCPCIMVNCRRVSPLCPQLVICVFLEVKN